MLQKRNPTIDDITNDTEKRPSTKVLRSLSNCITLKNKFVLKLPDKAYSLSKKCHERMQVQNK